MRNGLSHASVRLPCSVCAVVLHRGVCAPAGATFSGVISRSCISDISSAGLDMCACSPKFATLITVSSLRNQDAGFRLQIQR
eukprot:6585339-Prymnesium_polylepis.2